MFISPKLSVSEHPRCGISLIIILAHYLSIIPLIQDCLLLSHQTLCLFVNFILYIYVFFALFQSQLARCDLAVLIAQSYPLYPNLHHLALIKSPQAVKHTLNHHRYHQHDYVHLSLTGTERPCRLITKVHKLREEMVKYSPVSIISLSLIRMPASDNPYKSLRAIPYLKYRLILLMKRQTYSPFRMYRCWVGDGLGPTKQQAISQPGLS